MSIARNPDDVDDGIVSALNIRVHLDGSLCVEGEIGNKSLALGMIDEAAAAIKSHHAKSRFQDMPVIIDVDAEPDSVIAFIELKFRKNGSLSTGGTIYNLPYALAILSNAAQSVRDYHNRLEAGRSILTPSYDVTLH